MSADFGPDPRRVSPDYERHGGFPVFEPAEPGPGFARFLAGMRRLQDLAVSAAPAAETWDDAADRVEKLIEQLAPFESAEGSARPAGCRLCPAPAAC